MFPKIENLSDIRPYIEHKDEFKIREKDGYIVTDYTVSKEDTFNTPQSQEARGHKYFKDGQIAARLPHKFFNDGERPDLEDKYFTDDYRLYEKLDGSLIHFLPVDGELRAMTKAGITDVSLQCEKEIDFHPDFWSALRCILALRLTPCFEYTSPNNRIVIPYQKPELTLIAVRDNTTGKYHHLDNYANVLHVPRVKEVTNALLHEVADWTEKEGVVLVCSSGYMLKVKSHDYIMKHRTIDELSQEKNVLSMIIQDKVDDLAGILDENDYTRVKKFSTDVWDNLELHRDYLNSFVQECQQYSARKEVALAAKDKLSKPVLSSFWQVYEGQDAMKALLSVISKNLTSQSKIDSIRHLVGVRWEDYYADE